ncbi:AA-permease domain-containing protein [Fusarium sp. Ph1]|nr:AA-permease domain-containing protein [Fusarium sp. Ph1]
MAVWISLPGAIPQFCVRFVDPALGFAVGWNNWYFCAIAVPAEISAAAILVGYWTESVNVAVWISIFIILIVFLNVFGVGVYGEAEFIFASVKIITMVGLLILAFILDLGGGPQGDRLGFTYWNNPGAMREYMTTGDTGRFLGFFSVLVNAAFSYAGVEIVAQAAGVHTAAASPWVIAIKRASIPVLPSIINAVILSSALSSGNAFLYTGSRYLLALASNGHAPKFLLKTTDSGNPIYCVAATAIFSLLTYLSVSSGPNQIFLWFQSLITMCTLITWSSICVAYLHFYGGLKANNISRKTLVHRAPFQPYGAIIALVFFLIIIFFNGFAVFFPGNWNVYNFVTAYIGIPIFVVLFMGWKVARRTKWLSPQERDLFTGKAEIDALDEIWEDDKPKNIWQKIWNWIA